MGDNCYSDGLGKGICVNFFFNADVVCVATVQRWERVIKRRNDDSDFLDRERHNWERP